MSRQFWRESLTACLHFPYTLGVSPPQTAFSSVARTLSRDYSINQKCQILGRRKCFQTEAANETRKQQRESTTGFRQPSGALVIIRESSAARMKQREVQPGRP
jgi:hypothetical protein